MSPTANANERQLPMIEKIIQDETWLEGERRGCPVSEADPQVLDKVCGIVLTVGADLRRRAQAETGASGTA
ncbi:MAG: hypothetical protein ACFB20_11155 [Opitutales bacterium]